MIGAREHHQHRRLDAAAMLAALTQSPTKLTLRQHRPEAQMQRRCSCIEVPQQTVDEFWRHARIIR